MDCNRDDAVRYGINMIFNTLSEYLPGGKYQDLFLARWIPTTFAVLSEGFTEQNTFLNSNLKMVRSRITDHYKDTIDSLYTPEGKNILNEKNLKNMKLLLD